MDQILFGHDITGVGRKFEQNMHDLRLKAD